MTRTVFLAGLPAFMAALVACAGDEPTASVPRIDSSVVASAAIAPTLDPARTYEYDFSTVRPDSVLLALWQAGLPLAEAWLPIAYLCEDARGARLTVALALPESRMEDFDFRLGTGRLRCSEELWQYTVAPPDPQQFSLEATVRFVDLEGGCWTLVANETTRYEPIELAEEFRVDGLRVRVTLRHRLDMGSVCMVAPLAEVISISRL
jgi:hypothetical protein